MATGQHVHPVQAGPVVGAVRVVRAAGAEDAAPEEGLTSVVAVTIDPSEPVFAGHYPNFPIFPGVCVVECVHRGAAATAPQGWRLELMAMESVRFSGAVHPGDDLEITMRWRRSDGFWTCASQVRGPRATVAQVRLRYRAHSETSGAARADRSVR
ncbi:hypothetical protein O7634_28990 [Micromonospora sp. WMMD1120]|uniref:3-hydroxyacyl-ACP dehydratase FabZ family protein n=1 Tax=Micromonospora sp. WMMD1120 TaxID=3016106 RepID=UPI00241731D2|nr:hypothetical protein [Micromonospora sp. WMMD1120]MDG4810812.1 hypothetical protein [Micromonospora sp. WMMD1120]